MPTRKSRFKSKPKVPIVLTEHERINEFGWHESWMFERAPKLTRDQKQRAKHHEITQTKAQAKSKDMKSGKQRWTDACMEEECQNTRHPQHERCPQCEGDYRFWDGWE